MPFIQKKKKNAVFPYVLMDLSLGLPNILSPDLPLSVALKPYVISRLPVIQIFFFPVMPTQLNTKSVKNITSYFSYHTNIRNCAKEVQVDSLNCIFFSLYCARVHFLAFIFILKCEVYPFHTVAYTFIFTGQISLLAAYFYLSGLIQPNRHLLSSCTLSYKVCEIRMTVFNQSRK